MLRREINTLPLCPRFNRPPPITIIRFTAHCLDFSLYRGFLKAFFGFAVTDFRVRVAMEREIRGAATGRKVASTVERVAIEAIRVDCGTTIRRNIRDAIMILTT